jgi:5'-nucleotidase
MLSLSGTSPAHSPRIDASLILNRPAVQQSGKGGTFVLPTSNITEPGAEFGSVPAGAPFFGQDITNPNLCMYSFYAH